MILVSSGILLLLFILFFNFWLYYISPQSTLTENIKFLFYLIQEIFMAKGLFLFVKNGKTDQEYFLLRKKPAINYLYIHDGSAAITTDTDGQMKILTIGLHRLEKKEQVFATLDLSLQHFTLGPDPLENPFDLMKSGESYTDFHARQLRSQKGKASTKDNCEIYASFNIYYQLSPEIHQSKSTLEASLLELGQVLFEQKLEGEASILLQEKIGKAVSTHWDSLIQRYNFKDLFIENNEANLAKIMDELNTLFSPSKSTQKKSSHSNNNSAKLALPLFKLYLRKIWIQPGNNENGVPTL